MALALFVTALLPAEATAHRLDKFLQATRVALTSDGIRLELDLTPGATIAASVIARIDADHDGRFSGEEGARYAGMVLGDVGVWLDGAAVDLRLQHVDVSTPGELLDGVGTIGIVATGTLMPTGSRHQLRVRNRHDTARGVYLMNALIPPTKNIVITGQSRDERQQDFRVDYELRSAFSQGWWVIAAIMSLAVLGVCRLTARQGYFRLANG